MQNTIFYSLKVSFYIEIFYIRYEKLNKIEKFNNDIISCRVVLTKEANFEDVEIVMHGKGHHFVANENSENFEKSLISAVDKITIQVKKQHEKLIDH